MKIKPNIKKVIGYVWDDELYEEPTNFFWKGLDKELQNFHIGLKAFVDGNKLLNKLGSNPKPDFLLLDIIDKAKEDHYGFVLAQKSRAKGFKDPIFMISNDHTALHNLRQAIDPPNFVFYKKESQNDIAFSIYNFLTYSGITQSKIFIGHGRSKQWQKLKKHIESNFRIECEEFNSFPVEGLSVTERLSDMKNTAGLAFLVMTAEDEKKDGKFNARPNVIHEIGYFQGHLGFKKVIIFLQEGCELFTNFSGINYIHFTKDISSCFSKIEPLLKREKFF